MLNRPFIRIEQQHTPTHSCIASAEPAGRIPPTNTRLYGANRVTSARISVSTTMLPPAMLCAM